MLNDDDAAQCWYDFECFQRGAADQAHLSDGWHAPDEALWALLLEIEGGDVPHASRISLRLRRLSENRRRKYAFQEKSLRLYQRDFDTDADGPYDIAERRDLLAWVRLNTSHSEWQCLEGLAYGETYSELANRLAISIGTIKARVSRCRLRLTSQVA